MKNPRKQAARLTHRDTQGCVTLDWHVASLMGGL